MQTSKNAKSPGSSVILPLAMMGIPEHPSPFVGIKSQNILKLHHEKYENYESGSLQYSRQKRKLMLYTSTKRFKSEEEDHCSPDVN